MALTYEQKFNIAYPAPLDSGFPAVIHVLKKQIIAALKKTASIILIEDPDTTDHEARLRFAAKARSGDPSFVDSVIWDTLNDTNVESTTDATTVTDATVSGVVDGLPTVYIAAGQI